MATPRRSVAILSLCLLGALIVLVTPGGASATSPTGASGRERPKGTFVVVDQNVEKKALVVDALAEHAEKIDADAITMQEMCHVDAQRIGRQHPEWTVLWKRAHGTCKGRNDKGLGNGVIWTGGSNGTREGLTFEHQVTLNRKGHPRSESNMVCAVLPAGTRVCSTHLLSGFDAAADGQAREIRSATSPLISAGRTVVVAGDFNNRPSADRLDAMYSNGPGSAGRFLDAVRVKGSVCRCGEPTHLSRSSGSLGKIDYVFASTKAWRTGRASSLVVKFGSKKDTASSSDHAMLTARMDIRT